MIYYHKAHELCYFCDTDRGEEFLEDVGIPENPTYDKLACWIAFGELRARIEDALDAIIEEKRQ